MLRVYSFCIHHIFHDFFRLFFLFRLAIHYSNVFFFCFSRARRNRYVVDVCWCSFCVSFASSFCDSLLLPFRVLMFASFPVCVRARVDLSIFTSLFDRSRPIAKMRCGTYARERTCHIFVLFFLFLKNSSSEKKMCRHHPKQCSRPEKEKKNLLIATKRHSHFRPCAVRCYNKIN